MVRSKKLMALLLSLTLATSSFAGVPGFAQVAEQQSDSARQVLLLEQEAEREVNFNEGWRFLLGNPSNANDSRFDDSDWRQLDLPHDWSIELDFDRNSPSTHEGGYLNGGTGWYRKTFVLPAEWADKRVSIDFGGVYMDSTVYVNGDQVGNHPYGYTPFSYDITDRVTADGVTENVVAVKVVNQQPSSRWYSGSGIYRDVSLTVTEPVHVGRYGTFLTTPDLEEKNGTGEVTVNAQTDVVNDTEQAVEAVVTTTLYDPDGQEAARGTADAQTVAVGETVLVEQEIPVTDPVLWSTKEPNLYQAVTEIEVGGEIVDTYQTTFGFRWYQFDPDTGFSLNGTDMKLHGVCMHHDQGALGAVANYHAIERQMRMMKEMGVNAIRVTHNPAADELLEVCNKLGLMVIDEAFDTWYGTKKAYDYGRFFEKACTDPSAEPGMTWAEFDIKTMVDRGKNDPCVIMWSLGNEIGETNQAKGLTTARNLNGWIKEIDPTRLTTIGENKFKRNPTQNCFDVSDTVDVVGMNYEEPYYALRHEQHPTWSLYGSETSSAVKSRGIYQTNNALMQLTSYDKEHVGWGQTAATSWKAARDHAFIAGEFVWTGFDYIGEPTPYYNSYPAKSSYFGSVDTAGFPKDSFYIYQSQWTSVEDNPMVHILPHWNWGADKNVLVNVYSNAASVELFLNGESLGEKAFEQKVTDYGLAYQEAADGKLQLEWNVPFVPGELKAVAKDEQGEPIAEDVVRTAGEAKKLRVTPEEKIIAADGYDLSYITVDVTDENGTIVPDADHLIQFRVTGNGKIVGVDNGNPTSVERYKAEQRKAFSGKALVIVQSTKDEGAFTLTATSKGLESAQTKVFTIDPNSEETGVVGYETPDLTIKAGEIPSLPEQVTAIYADGSEETVAVTWGELPDLTEAGSYRVDGDTEDGGSVTLLIHVRGEAGVKAYSAATLVGSIPQLPETVQVLYTDASVEDKPVEWDAITPEMVSEEGVFTLYGAVEGTSRRAAATIRVSSESVQTNVARKGEAITSFPGNDNIHSINDGVLRPANAGSTRWTNWQASGQHRASDWVGIALGQAYTVDQVAVDFYTDGAVSLPKSLIVETSIDGETWTPVANQSNTDSFVLPATGRSNDITFDPVEAGYVRINMTCHTNGSGAPDKFIGVTELQVFSHVVAAHSNAALSAISVDGQPLEGFQPNVYQYEYAVGFDQDVPAITAEAADNAAVSILQAVNTDSAALVYVQSEDHSVENIYTIQFVPAQAPLQKAVLSAVRTDITEDDTEALLLEITLTDGSKVDRSACTVKYTVQTEGEAQAEVKEHALYANSGPGAAIVTAEVTYGGDTVSSNALRFTIAANPEKTTITSYEAVRVLTDRGRQPTLPERIKATFNTGLPKLVPVVWDTIPEEKLEEYGTFTVEGTVEGQKLKPTATVVVQGNLAAKNLSMATPVGIPPALPEQVPVYLSNGGTMDVAVVWDAYDDTLLWETGTFVVNGTTETGVPVSASIRVSDETIKGDNVAAAREGWALPIAVASFTHDINPPNSDSVAEVNDGLVSYDANVLKNKWTNWQRGTQRAGDWVGVVFGLGLPEKKYIDNLEVHFYTDSGASLPADFQIQYYVGEDAPVIPENPGRVAQVADNAMNEEANWQDVTNLVSDPAQTAEKAGNTYTFDTVETYAIRIKMTGVSGKCLGITEMRAFEKSVAAHDDFTVEEILVDGTPLQLAGGQKEYEIEVSGTEVPAVTAKADHNAAVTILSASRVPGITQIIFTSETGTNEESYRIRFVQKAEEPVRPQGSGTQADPFRITSAAELDSLHTLGTSRLEGLYYYSVENDIDLSDRIWMPIGTKEDPFRGTVLGNGHTISGLRVESADSHAGLFGSLKEAVIESLTVEVDTVQGKNYVGALAGYANEGTITDCHATGGTVTATAEKAGEAGGLLGVGLYTVIRDSSASVEVRGYSNIGGLLGDYSGEGYYGEGIANCYATGDVTTTNTEPETPVQAGGLIGKCATKINAKGGLTNCYATGDVIGAGRAFGGLVGRSGDSAIVNCYATGEVGGTKEAGGLIGQGNVANLVNCYSTGTVKGEAGKVGGFVGNANGVSFTDCYWNQAAAAAFNGWGTPKAGEPTAMAPADMQKLSFALLLNEKKPTLPKYCADWGFDAEKNNGLPVLCGVGVGKDVDKAEEPEEKLVHYTVLLSNVGGLLQTSFEVDVKVGDSLQLGYEYGKKWGSGSTSDYGYWLTVNGKKVSCDNYGKCKFIYNGEEVKVGTNIGCITSKLPPVDIPSIVPTADMVGNNQTLVLPLRDFTENVITIPIVAQNLERQEIGFFTFTVDSYTDSSRFQVKSLTQRNIKVTMNSGYEVEDCTPVQTMNYAVLLGADGVAKLGTSAEWMGQFAVVVKTVAVTGVTLDKTNLTLEEDATDTLTATVLPENATNKNVTWTSEDPTVATVEDGVVTAKKSGTTVVTVRTVDGDHSATCNVTVKAAGPEEPQALTVTYGSNVTLKVNGEAQPIADKIGRYQVQKVEEGTAYRFTFEPRLSGRMFRSVTVGDAESAIISGSTYNYDFTMGKEEAALNFTFEVTDKSVLGLIVDYAKERIDAGDVEVLVPDVKTQFMAAYSTAKAVNEDAAATQAEINKAWSDLLHMIHYLEFRAGDKEDLRDMIAIAEGLQEANYTAASWVAMQAKLSEAKDVEQDKNALENDVKTATEALYDAIMELKLVTTNWSGLQKLLEEAERIESVLDSEYLPIGQDAFKEALKAAKELPADATQAQIDAAVKTLTVAIAGLQKIPNKDALKAILDRTANVDLSGYPAEKVAYYEASRAIAENAMNNPLATQADVDSACEGLQDAWNKLHDNHNSSKPSGGNSGSSGNSYGGAGTASAQTSPLVAAAQGVTAQASVRSDTTLPFVLKRGSAYCFKMTVVNGLSLIHISEPTRH